jgi:hypothetical protein
MRYLLILILSLTTAAIYGQQVPEFKGKDTAAMVKASYLYNFSKFIDWPTEYKSGNFVISVMGGGNLHQELVKKYNNKQIGSQQIEIRKLSKTLNISPCHVLFIGGEYTEMLPEITNALKGQPILIVAEQDGSLEKGAILNFVVIDHQYRFEVDLKNAENRELFIGSTIKSLALKVQ